MEEQNWGFSRREKLGLFGFAAITIFFLLSGLLFSSKNNQLLPQEISDFEKVVHEANLNRKLLAVKKKEAQEAKYKAYKEKHYPKVKSKTPFPKNKNYKKKQKPKSKSIDQPEEIQEIVLSNFNPNLASLEDLLQLGIPSKTANTIVNFRNKGGQFLKTEDLKIVYGLSDVLYNKLKDFIHIPAKEKVQDYTLPPAKPQIKVALNTSDAEEFMQLKGIGPTLSARIIKYRDKLDGFTSVDQLSEIYNLPDSTLNSIKSNLIIKKAVVKRSIQNTSMAALRLHPYISRKMIGKMITRIDRNEKFNNWSEFENYFKITPKELENIQQYFTIP